MMEKYCVSQYNVYVTGLPPVSQPSTLGFALLFSNTLQMPPKQRTKQSKARNKATTTKVVSKAAQRSTLNNKAKSDVRSTPEVKPVATPSVCRVFVSEGLDGAWAETTEVRMVSRFGAGFDLSRECKVGTLIEVEIALAREFRAFDEDKESYRVVALVQNSSKSGLEPQTVYHTNVIFVGKSFPASYYENPQQTSRLSSSVGDGIWKVTECKNSSKQRRYPRFKVELNVEIGLIQKHERMVMWERTETCDIGSVGVSVITTLPAVAGDKLKFSCIDLDFHAIATVVKRRNYFGFRDVLHLKFGNERFPVDRLLFSQVEGRMDLTVMK